MKNKILYILIAILAIISIAAICIHFKNEEKKNIKEYVTVKFEVEEEEISDKKLEKGSKIGELTKPTKPGYKFLYWTVNDKEIDENYIVEEDVILKPKFEEIKLSIDTYVVVFNTNGAAEINNQIINKAEKVVKPDDPVKKGYIFMYWTYNDIEYDFDTPVTKDLALRAYFKLDNSNDKNAPNLKLKGDDKVTIKVGEEYKELGYTAIDDYDGDVTSNVKVTGNVDNTKAGSYILTYTVSDEKGNSIDKTRTIIVEE